MKRCLAIELIRWRRGGTVETCRTAVWRDHVGMVQIVLTGPYSGDNADVCDWNIFASLGGCMLLLC